MASAEADQVYRNRDTIIAELASALQARLPDANLTRDSIWRIWIETIAVPIEGLFLANQLLHNDMFIQTANALALLRYGEMYGREIKGGTRATGNVRVTGSGGAIVPVGTQVGAAGASDETLLFNVTAPATIPNPGEPTAPTVAVLGTAGPPAGTYEYGITFSTNEGETALGEVSNAAISTGDFALSLTGIPVGGPGTTKRNVYRSVDGGQFQYIASINDNSTTTYTDTMIGAFPNLPPIDSTAEAVTVPVEADEVGTEYNVGIGAVNVISSPVAGLSEVTNIAAFVGGDDQEDIEDYRTNLLRWVRAPQSGSLADLEAWALQIDGVETATAIQNDNLGVSTPGHVTVRISGPNGAIPDSTVQANVLAALLAHDFANISIHVATFATLAVNVTVTVTRQSGYLLADISDSVTKAIQDYINSVPVGGTVYVAGIIDAVFGLPGVATVTVSSPGVDTTATSSQKPVPGTITVS